MNATIKKAALRLAERYDSFYLYNEAGIESDMERLHTCFPEVKFFYSIKCNSKSSRG